MRDDRSSEDGLGLDANGGPEEARELEALVSLLRSLPDPEPHSDLTARVMARVLEIEARPPSLIRLWIPTSRTAAALAASIAVVAVGIGIRQAQLQTGFPSSDPIVRASATVAAQPRRDATRGSLSLVSTYPGARPTAFFGRGVPEPALQGFATVTPDQHLDAQLNELQLDPQAFFRRLERVQDRERFIQRLAERAARRGDAAQVGLRVRSVQHRLAPPMGEQFLQASLVQQVSAHR